MNTEAMEIEKQLWPEVSAVPDLQPVDMLSQVEIIGIREGGLIDCWVPTDLIDHEEVPVKAHWVESLAKDMRDIAKKDGGTGQLAPILLGKIEGESLLKIIDGFHRDAALVENGEKRILATIKETDLEELYDIRIFTAKDHAHVRFSRVVQWIREVWSISGLEDRLNVEQAVLLYRFDSSGHNLKLSSDEVIQAKEWVSRKEKQWQMAAMTIHSHLKVAENVDPLIVHATREKKSGHVLEAPTQAIVRIFSKEIPGNFVMQNYVMDIAKAHNLKGPQVKALCMTVKDFTEVSEAEEVVQWIDWTKWQPKFGETKNRLLRRQYDPRYKGAAVLDSVSIQIANITERVEQSLRLKEKNEPAQYFLIQEAEKRVKDIESELGALSAKLSLLRKPQELAPEIPESSDTSKSESDKTAEEIAESNRKRHETWGLKFTLYDDGSAPTVHLNNQARYELGDSLCLLLQCVAERSSCDVISAEQIAALMVAKGHRFSESDQAKEVRTAIREISSIFKRFGKDSHIIIRTGGQKQVSFGLAV